MFLGHGGLFLLGVLQLQAAGEEPRKPLIKNQIERPFIELFNLTSQDRYSRSEVKSLRSILEKDRDQEIETAEAQTKESEKELKAARKDLEELNRAASRDTPVTSARRGDLHQRIARLERELEEAKRDREIRIPLTYELRLAKLRIVQQWPERRAEIERQIAAGAARSRKFGNIEDIGYRKWVKDQEKDIALGDQAVRQMTASGAIPLEARQEDVQNYVRNLAARLAKNSDLKIPLQVSVIENPSPHAVGLPGGYLFVTTGLIAASEQESELALVLSREIARIASRHGTRSSKRSLIPKIFVPATQVATGFLTGGATSAGAYYSMNYGIQGLSALMEKAFAGSDEKFQKEADQLGIQYAWKAGFDPRGFIMFIDAMSTDKDIAKAATFFRARQKFEKRMMDVFSEIQYLPTDDQPVVDSVEFRIAKWSLAKSQS